MKKVVFEDEKGKKRVVVLPDDVADTEAYSGIPMPMPDVTELDWEEISITLNNLIVERGIHSLDDLSKDPNLLVNAIVSVIKPRVINLYRIHLLSDESSE